MIKSEYNNIKIEGIMTAVPKNKEIVHEKYSELFGENVVHQFSDKTGVKERYVAEDKQTACDLVYVAARELLNKKQILKEEIGVVVFVTQTPDYIIPSSACVLHKRLGLSKDCMAFDVNMGCSGYVYGMQILAALMNSSNVKYGLLLGGDTLNKLIAPEDKASVMLFGDAGSATLVEKVENASPIQIACRTDGEGYKSIIIPAGGCRNSEMSRERVMWGDGNKRSDYDFYMNGLDVVGFTISEVPKIIDDFLKFYSEERNNFDDFVLHQANAFILKQLVKKCNFPKEKVPISIDRFGNTSVASIPLTICDKYGERNGDKNIRILSCGFGIGLSWGILTMTLKSVNIYPIIQTDEYYVEGEVGHD